MLAMKIVNLSEIDGGDNVAIYHHKGMVVPEVLDIFDRTAGSEDLRFKSS